MRTPALKRIPVPAQPLSKEAVMVAVAAMIDERHDGYADLIVHPSQVRTAQKIASGIAGPIKVRVLLESRYGMDAWLLRTKTAEVVSL